MDLNKCDQECLNCIKYYKNKHSIKKGDKFEIVCDGILSESVLDQRLKQFSEDQRILAKTIWDPVTWAARTLDWHCIDEDGEIWKRKDPEEYYDWIKRNPNTDIKGHSRYDRPYQKVILRCSSKYRVMRLGRQLGKSESLIILMLYHAVTHKDFAIVFVAPRQNQVDLIFRRLEQLIDSSDELKNTKKRSVKSPMYQILFNNESYISGFTAGSGSGGEGTSIRGQHANMLCLDEADYLEEADIGAALAVITNYPNAKVIISSTPTGRREQFYETCLSPLYKEFYYPSWDNPMWSKETESGFRSQLTEIQYIHEIHAEFGSQEEGVFQGSYIDRATAKYRYEDMKYESSWQYYMGVDWNGHKTGTTIYVIGRDPKTMIFYGVYKDKISREGWTQLLACKRIAELNAIWNPEFIYVDSGYGHVQAEVLRSFSYQAISDPSRGPDHPDSKIKDRLFSYDFGNFIEISDPFTHQTVKKKSKNFLVETTVRRFEQADFFFPESDIELKKQLLNYVVKKVGSDGQPIYGLNNISIGDHMLDALMLAFVAFYLNKTPYSKKSYYSKALIADNIMESFYQHKNEDDDNIDDESKVKKTSRPDMNRESKIFKKKLHLPAQNMNNANTISSKNPKDIILKANFGRGKLRKTSRPSRSNF